jgi:hypothetical protein
VSFSDTGDAVGDEKAAEPTPVDILEHDAPPLKERALGILTEPVKTFSKLEPAWGLLGPWAAVAVAGILYAIVAMAQVDFAGLADKRAAYELTLLSDQQRRAVAQVEQTLNPGKLGSVMARLGLVLGPTVGTILAIVVVGLLLFGAAALLGGKKDLLRSIVVAAHAKLIAVLSYAILLVALVLGNPAPTTSLKNAVDEAAQPLQAAILSIFDPIALWHTLLLGIGLAVALGMKRTRAAVVAAALHVIPWLAGLGFAALSLAQRR